MLDLVLQYTFTFAFLIYEMFVFVPTDLNDASADEGDGDGNSVDRQLELQELCDAVVDVATPHHRLDDTRKVVVRQYDIGRLFGHVGSCYALNYNANANTLRPSMLFVSETHRAVSSFHCFLSGEPS